MKAMQRCKTLAVILHRCDIDTDEHSVADIEKANALPATPVK